MIKNLIYIVLVLLSDSLSRNDAPTDNSDFEICNLNKIDISSDSIMQCILKDAIQQENQCDSVLNYYLGYGKLCNGTLINICEYRDSILNYNMYPNGFIQYKGHKVIVVGDGSYKLKGAYPKISTSILKRRDRPSIDSSLTNMSYFYIMCDIWAKFCPSKGWIWSDGKPDK